jgi:hypothetical protein
VAPLPPAPPPIRMLKVPLSPFHGLKQAPKTRAETIRMTKIDFLFILINPFLNLRQIYKNIIPLLNEKEKY